LGVSEQFRRIFQVFMLENRQKLIGSSFGFFSLLELISATLLEIDHGVVTHLIAGAMLT